MLFLQFDQGPLVSAFTGWCRPTLIFIIILQLGPEDAELVVFNKPLTTDRINSRKSKRREVPVVT